MSNFIVTELLNVAAVGVSGEGALVNTSGDKVNKNVRPAISKGLSSPAAQLTISATAHTGTSMLVSVVAVVDGVDHEIGVFTALTGVGVETINLAFCPEVVKIKYVETAMTVWTAKVNITRL